MAKSLKKPRLPKSESGFSQSEKLREAFLKQFSYATTDYHNFLHRGTSKELLTKLDIGPLYTNGATCGECGYFIRSRNRHDMVTCLCGNVSVDGGSWYAKRSYKTDNYTDVLERFDNYED